MRGGIEGDRREKEDGAKETMRGETEGDEEGGGIV